MSSSNVTRDGITGEARPGREALTGVHAGKRRRGGRQRGRRGEQPMVPEVEFASHCGSGNR